MPQCFDDMEHICPGLYSFLRACRDGTSYAPCTIYEESCFCHWLLRTSCPGLCTRNKGDAKEYLERVLDICPFYLGDPAYTGYWPDKKPLLAQALWDLFPWGWRIQPTGPTAKNFACPSNESKLASFAVINIVVFLSCIVLGRRDTIRKLTRGILGRPSSIWPLFAIISAGLNLFANYVIAVSISSLPGFAEASSSALVLFWIARPRAAWLGTALVKIQREKSIYFSMGATALLTELILQVIGAVYLGLSVNFAARSHFYDDPGRINIIPGSYEAKIMYAGAIMWMASVGLFFLQALFALAGLGSLARSWIRTLRRYQVKKISLASVSRVAAKLRPDAGHSPKPDGPAGAEQQPQSPVEGGPNAADVLGLMGLSERRLKAISFTILFMFLPFVGQWMFWAGFIHLAGDL